MAALPAGGAVRREFNEREPVDAGKGIPSVRDAPDLASSASQSRRFQSPLR